MQERELHGVPDLFDLRAQAADVLVADVRHVFQDQGLDLAAVDLLQSETGAPVHGHRVTDPHAPVAQRTREADDPLVIGAADDQHAVVTDQFLDGDHFAGLLETQSCDHHEGLVQQHFLADGELVDVDQGADPHTHLPPAVEDVHGLLHGGVGTGARDGFLAVVQLCDRGEAVGRLPFLLQRGLEPLDLGLGGLEHADQPRVVLGRGGELAVHIAEFVPQHVDLPFGNALVGSVVPRLVRGVTVGAQCVLAHGGQPSRGKSVCRHLRH